MKKILAFLLAVSMILAMAACAAAPAQTTTETAQTEQNKKNDGRNENESPRTQNGKRQISHRRLRRKRRVRPRV